VSRKFRTVDCSAAGPLFDVQVSHKGDLLAVVPNGAPMTDSNRQGIQKTDVQLWSVEQRRQIGTLAIGEMGVYTAFLDAKRLLVCSRTQAGIWDLDSQTLKEPWPQINVRGWGLYRPFAISHDGRFLANGNRQIVVYDLHDQGRVRAILYAPSFEKDYEDFSQMAMAFSPDGRELAQGWASKDHRLARLASWDWARGRQVEFVSQELPYGHDHAPPWSLSWLSSRKGWVLGGDQLVARQTRKPVAMLSKARAVSSDLRTFVLPDGSIADLTSPDGKSIQVDYRTPPLSETKAEDLPAGEWKPGLVMPADPPPPDQWKVDPKIELTIPRPDVSYPAANSPHMLVDVRETDWTFLDFRTAQIVPLKPRGGLVRHVSISADGTWVSIEEPGDVTFTRYRANPKTEHRPDRLKERYYCIFRAATGIQEVFFVAKSNFTGAFFRLLPGNRVVTENEFGSRLLIHEIPSQKLLAQLPLLLGSGGEVALSGGSRYLAHGKDGWVVIYDLNEFRVCAQMQNDFPETTPKGLAFNHATTKLGFFYRVSNDATTVGTLDLATGKYTSSAHRAIDNSDLQSLPDGRWRVGRHVWNDEGELLGTLTEAPNQQVIHTLDDGMLVGVDSKPPGPAQPKPPMTIRKVPVPQRLFPTVPPPNR
jgi:hypothetical protein